MIFDTHAHYDDRQFEEDRAELLDSMQENGVELIVDAGSDIASWDKIEQLTDRYPFIYGAIGVHPDEVGELNEEKMQQMERLLSGEKMIAVGEIGLDYYWIKRIESYRKSGLSAAGTCETTGSASNHHIREAAGRHHGDGMEQHPPRTGWSDPLFFLSLEQAKLIREHGILSGDRWSCHLQKWEKIKRSGTGDPAGSAGSGDRQSVSGAGSAQRKT